MSDYKRLVEAALKNSKKVKTINESILYPEGMNERMHPKLEEDLLNKTHSLGKHPIFPEGDESSFEEKIMGERFSDVTKRYKRAFDVTEINNHDVMSMMQWLSNLNTPRLWKN